MKSFANISFSSMPAMRPIGWKRQEELLELVSIIWRQGEYPQEIVVPVGFVHNGPSIPNRLRGIVFYTHRQLRPSIVHDYLYTYGYKIGWTRKEADRLFFESLKTEGVWRLRRRVMWLAVRAAGRSHWSKS